MTDHCEEMQLEQPAWYLVLTQTSTYVIDTGALCAHRSPRGAASPPLPSGGPGLVHRRLFTDGFPLVLVSVPEVEVGHPMRLMVEVADEFLDRPREVAGTPMVTTPVVEVSRLE